MEGNNQRVSGCEQCRRRTTTRFLIVACSAGWIGLGDMLVPAFYYSDGLANSGIWWGSTDVWMIPGSSTSDTDKMFAAWGVSSDIPALGDYDGDGIADLAVFSLFGVQQGLGQVIGLSLYGSYWGVDSKVYTPDPSIIDQAWVAAPVGVCKFYVQSYGDGFIESGPIKWCLGGCSLHPYSNYNDTNGNGNFHLDTSITLGSGLLYRYRAYYLSSNNWEADFCSGAGCTAEVTANLQTNQLPFVADGGESSAKGIEWEDIDNRENKYKSYNGSTYDYWCYSNTYIGQPGGSISSCNTSIYGWTVSYK
jgi:hypothetical protein